MTHIEPAIQAWRLLLGPARVLTAPSELKPYMASTSAVPVAPLAVLRPLSHGEVVAVVRSAGEFKIPLYPISTGRNWGYGDANPCGEGQVIVDLGGMNRILDINRELAYTVIEPGVTQAQLAGRLAEQGLPLWMDCTGAGPDTSLVGNILERGFGHTPYGNRILHVAGMRIVLANGDTLETGYSHFARAAAAHLYPYGVGPWLDGLFTQSNLGIVTSLGFWLMPQTQVVSHLVASVSRFEDIAAVVDALRPLRMDGTLSSVVCPVSCISGMTCACCRAARCSRMRLRRKGRRCLHSCGPACAGVPGSARGQCQPPFTAVAPRLPTHAAPCARPSRRLRACVSLTRGRCRWEAPRPVRWDRAGWEAGWPRRWTWADRC
jgi:hypothetical protein